MIRTWRFSIIPAQLTNAQHNRLIGIRCWNATFLVPVEL